MRPRFLWTGYMGIKALAFLACAVIDPQSSDPALTVGLLSLLAVPFVAWLESLA